MTTFDYKGFRLVINAAREAFKTASSDSMREWVNEQVARFVIRTLTASECLDELAKIQLALDSIYENDHGPRSDYAERVISVLDKALADCWTR